MSTNEHKAGCWCVDKLIGSPGVKWYCIPECPVLARGESAPRPDLRRPSLVKLPEMKG